MCLRDVLSGSEKCFERVPLIREERENVSSTRHLPRARVVEADAGGGGRSEGRSYDWTWTGWIPR